MAHWRRLHGLSHPVPVAVNVSLSELSDPKFPEMIGDVLAETDLPPSHLILEVKENAMIERVEFSLEGLNKLHEIGVGIAIDDFGHGMASLAYIKRLDMVTQIKVNPDFVHGVVNSEADRAIAGAIISVGNALGKSTIAEGVENESQLEVLELLGVTNAQGNLLGAPVEPAKLGDLLIRRDDVLEAAVERITDGQQPDPMAGRGGRRGALGAPKVSEQEPSCQEPGFQEHGFQEHGDQEHGDQEPSEQKKLSPPSLFSARAMEAATEVGGG